MALHRVQTVRVYTKGILTGRSTGEDVLFRETTFDTQFLKSYDLQLQRQCLS